MFILKSFNMLAQYSEDKGISLGGIFDKAKINAEDYTDVIEKIAKVNLGDVLDGDTLSVDKLSKAIGNSDDIILKYATTLKDAEGNIDLTTASTDGLRIYLEQAGNSFNFAAIKATLFNTALNAGIMLVFSVALQAIVKGIDNYVHRAKNAINLTEELKSKHAEAANTLESHKKTVDELSASYEKLSKGVNTVTNTNLSLSDEDYQSYLDITNELAEAFPTLQKTLDENGNAILTLGQNGRTVSQDLQELLQAEEDLNNFKIAQDIDDLFGGVDVKLQEAKEAMDEYNSSSTDLESAFETLKQMSTEQIDLSSPITFSGDTSTRAGAEYYNSIVSALQEFYKSIDAERRVELSDIIDPGKITTVDNNGVFDIYLNTLQLTDDEKAQLQSIIKEQASEVLPLIQDEIGTIFSEQSQKQQEAELAWQDFLPSLVSTMKSKESFKGLADDAFGEEIQNFAIDLVSNLDSSVAEQMDGKPYEWVRNNIILPLTQLDDSERQIVIDVYSKLLELNPNDLSEVNQSAIEGLISQIAQKLGKPEADIRLNLGFEIDDDLQAKYTEAVNNAISKFGDSKDSIEGIFSELGIDTSAEIDKWNEIANEVDNATEAKKRYSEINIQTDNISVPDLDTLNDQIDSIQSAYKALYSASDEYNKNGYVTADTLQTLLALDSEYLACLIDENGQLTINGTAYQNLVQAKLADAQATAIKQAIEELSKVTTEQQIEADKTAIGIIAEKGSVLASLTGQYGALADVAVSAAQAQALADGYTEASNRNKAEADKIMSNLNAKLALIQSTAKNTAGSFGSLTNHLNGFSNASSKAKDKTDAFTKSLQKQKDALEDEEETLKDKKEYYEKVSSAVNWFFDKQIKGVEKVISGLEKENDLLKEQLGDFDSALSAVDRLYERQQNALKDKISAMKEATIQSEKELAVEKAKMALQEAQRNKTKMLYVKGKGFTFTKDDTAISEANDNLANANADLVEYKIQQEIDKIQELRDAWAEIPKIKQQAEQDSLASQIIGSNWEAQLLNGRLETINTFKDSYLGIQAEIDNNESMIASYEEKVQYFQNLKDEWQALIDRYTEYENTQLLIMEFGNDYQNELLNGRTERWDKFADDFFNVQVQLKSVTDQIADITKRMEDYAARMEAAASRAESAAARIKAAGNGVGSGNDTSERSYYLKPYDFTGHAKGGVVTKRDKSSLDPLAEAVGEDHMIAVQEGEYVVPKKTVEKNPEIVDALSNSDDVEKGLEKEGWKKIERLNIDDKTFGIGSIDPEVFERFNVASSMTSWNIPTPEWDPEKYINNTTNNNQNTTELHFHGNLSFPNITDGNDARKLIDELSSISLKAHQYANKR